MVVIRHDSVRGLFHVLGRVAHGNAQPCGAQHGHIVVRVTNRGAFGQGYAQLGAQALTNRVELYKALGGGWGAAPSDVEVQE